MIKTTWKERRKKLNDLQEIGESLQPQKTPEQKKSEMNKFLQELDIQIENMGKSDEGN